MKATVVLSVILFNGLTADETCFGCAPAPLLLLICIPRVCFLQRSLHHLIYILQYDIKIVHRSKQHSTITEGNVGLHMVRLTQEHNDAALVFKIWPFSLPGIDPDILWTSPIQRSVTY